MGDAENIFDRIDRGLTVRSSVTPVLKQLISRAVEGSTFINRIISTTGQKKAADGARRNAETVAGYYAVFVGLRQARHPLCEAQILTIFFAPTLIARCWLLFASGWMTD